MMSLSEHDIARLLAKRLVDPLTTQEEDRLQQWRTRSTDNERRYQELVQLPSLQSLMQNFQEAVSHSANVSAPVVDILAANVSAADIPPVDTSPARISIMHRRWIPYAAAAIIILLSTCIYLWDTMRHANKPSLAGVQTTLSHDILPGNNKAVLTLSDGKQVELNNATSETISDGSFSIANNNGQLSYLNPSRGSNSLRRGASERSEEGAGVAPSGTNTMTTPRGGQYQLTLSDGTKIWLNAASSITYPTTFTSKTREITITGEAYLEIAKNKEKPFIVKTSKEEITVLGTSFNINTYPDEPFMKTSLIEGSIKVNNLILHPGQAVSNGKIITTNIQQDIAWKNGVFNFQNMPLDMVFRQLSRWYNLNIHYAGAIPNKRIGGKMGRDLNLSQVLLSLNDVGIHTQLEGNTLTILSN